MAIGGVTVVLANRLDQFLVSAWFPGAPTGAYFAASRLTELAVFSGTAVVVSILPALAEAHGRGMEAFMDQLQAAFDLLSGLGWLIALFFALLGPVLVPTIFGPGYAEAVPVLLIQGWTCLLLLSGSVRWQFILLTASTTLNLAAALAGIAVQATLATWLLPQWQLPGAAAAALFAAAASGWWSTFLFPALRPCARMQTRALVVLFAPRRWPAAWRLLVS